MLKVEYCFASFFPLPSPTIPPLFACGSPSFGLQPKEGEPQAKRRAKETTLT